MENLSSAVQLMRKNCYMASIDLTDAYYTVPVAPEHRIYLSSAPRYFTKLLKPMYGTLCSQGNVGYIDDS